MENSAPTLASFKIEIAYHHKFYANNSWKKCLLINYKQQVPKVFRTHF